MAKDRKVEGEVVVAYDNKTVLDLVKAVGRKGQIDRIHKVRELQEDYRYGPVPGEEELHVLDRGAIPLPPKESLDKELSQLTKDVLKEENPLAGGTFKGSQYFSNLRPQGKGDEKFSVEAQNIIDDAFRTNRTKKDVLKAQEYLAEIEYIHPSEIDGKFGEQTRKALNRLRTNMNKDPEALYHAMRDIDIFKRDK